MFYGITELSATTSLRIRVRTALALKSDSISELTLNPGTRLGPYEIVAPLGAGGMGEVYRARDTKLDRDVAIKVLPELFVSDPERVARFQREAKTLAALNHPHIGGIYGLEDASGVRALVLELVDGPTLADRIAQGPIPLDEVLPIARQIAEALEAAHEQGIIHRDLKPANIKLRPDGTVKVLDFGLAKALEPISAASANVTASPTITTPAMMTGIGMILGTAAYMSPEQAKGRPADKRSDVWAFGAVSYEMLAGRRAFDGNDVSDVLASVLKTEPDWTALPATTPAPIRRMLRRCLDKDRRRRLDSAADARLEIDEALSRIGDALPPSATFPEAAWKRALPWAVAGTAVAGLLLVLALWAPWRQTVPPHVTRLAITTAGSALTINGTDRDLALSPDGRHVVYSGNNGTQLFVRALEALEPVAIVTGSSGAIRSPFISPDGQWVGFSSGGNTIQKVAITGGPPIRLATLDGSFRGATWTPDDTIVFSTNNPTTGLQRVAAASGGTPEVLTRPNHAQGEGDHISPEILPGGRAVLFTIMPQTGVLDSAVVAVLDLRTGTQKVVLRGGSHAHYVAVGPGPSKRASPEGGHLVYVAAGTLRAIAFDPTRLETFGSAVPVLARLATTSIGAGDFDVAADGTLVYVDAPGRTNERMLVWVDRTGKEESVAAPARAYQQPRISPDGTRIALWSSDLEDDIWIWDLGRQTLTRLTLDPGQDRFPVWTPDGQRIVFSSNRGGALNLWWQAADGTGAAERLTTSSNNQFLTGITPDGAAVVFFEATLSMGADLLQLALDGTRRVTPLVQTQFDERNGIVSPDGRWLAYESNSSGRYEIFVRPFPNTSSGQWQVSTSGGTRPLWARNGKELFYVATDGGLLSTPVEASGGSWNAGPATKLLEGRYLVGVGTAGRTYDVSPDGRRFLMLKASGTDGGTAPPPIIVVQHWDEELKRLVPTR